MLAILELEEYELNMVAASHDAVEVIGITNYY